MLVQDALLSSQRQLLGTYLQLKSAGYVTVFHQLWGDFKLFLILQCLDTHLTTWLQNLQTLWHYKNVFYVPTHLRRKFTRDLSSKMLEMILSIATTLNISLNNDEPEIWSLDSSLRQWRASDMIYWFVIEKLASQWHDILIRDRVSDIKQYWLSISVIKLYLELHFYLYGGTFNITEYMTLEWNTK